MTLAELKKYDLPEAPGIYIFKEKGKIGYIGKATSLRDRVRSYFASDLIATRGPRIVDMVYKADALEWQESDSVLEAMIAEANAIKKHQPHYNVQEKDDKSFNYVVITREIFPRILIIRGRTLDVERQKKDIKIQKIFGPFPNGNALREALKIIRRMFPFADKGSLGRDKYQFYRQLGLTPDVNSAEAKSEYAKTIKYIILFFQGKKKELVRDLDKEMSRLVKGLEFEKAALVREKIFALDHIQDIALIKEDVEAMYDREKTVGEQAATNEFRIEAYDTAHMSGKNSVAVMTVVTDGRANKAEYRKFKLDPDIGNNDVASLREVLRRRFNHDEWRTPNLIVIDGGMGQINAATKSLAEMGRDIPIVSIVKDERHKPSDFLGDSALVEKYKKGILLANNEAHRFAIAYHRKLRRIRNPFRKKL